MRRKYVELSELAEVVGGYAPKPGERLSEGAYRLLTGRNLGETGLLQLARDQFINAADTPGFARAILKADDVIVSLLFKYRKLYIYRKSDPVAVGTDSLAIIRAEGDTYIRDYLNTVAGRERFLQEAAHETGGEHIPRIRLGDLRQIRIPILTQAEIQELGKAQQGLVGNELLSLIEKGESTRLEFKSTLRQNLQTRAGDPRMEDEVLKTIAAFCNSAGGTLLIGVENEGNILGIEADRFKDADKFLLHLGNLIRDRLEPAPVASVDYRLLSYGQRQVCVVTCQPSNTSIWFSPKAKSQGLSLFVRTGPQSRALEGPDLAKYILDRFSS